MPKNYDDIPTEQQKAKARKDMHRKRPDLGAVNDKRRKKGGGGGNAPDTSGDPTPEEINARLDAKEAEGLINITQLADKYAMDPKKVRAIIRGLGHKAPPVKDPHPSNFGPKAKYEFPVNSPELNAIEDALKKQAK